MSQPTVIASPRTIGFDIGARASVFCVLDTSGDVSIPLDGPARDGRWT